MQDTLLNFQKIFPLSKNGGHFEFLTKMVKLNPFATEGTLFHRTVAI